MNDPIFGHDQGATLNGRPIDGVLANHGQHAVSLPITHRIARDSTRRRRAGFASEPRSTSATSSDACAVDLRPSPRAFANVERRSE
jgi:hypothetical protein